MKFKLGDLCEVVASNGFTSINTGCFVVIIGFRDIPSMSMRFDGEPMYLVSGSRNGVVAFEESRLRLRRPPSWDLFIFDTSHVEHENKQPVSA